MAEDALAVNGFFFSPPFLLLSFLVFYHLWGGCSGGEGWVCLGREWVVVFVFFSKKREVGKRATIEHENFESLVPTYLLTYIPT